MSQTTYALLVGIDAYPAPVNPLRGCVNDIHRLETLLRERLTPAGAQSASFQPRVLTDAQATRQAIIDGFRQHLSQAGAEDVALFYYSGHGSQAPSPPAFWHLEPDRLDETLVCWDSRLPEPDRWDLADKELAQLIAEVAAGGAHVVVILDSCHSGSGTRAAAESEVRSRRVPTDERTRPIESFLVSAEQATELGATGGDARGGGWFRLPRGRHVVLSACSPEEEAKELALGGEQRGAFSYYLLETLQRASAPLTYRDLAKRVNALVRANVALQSPQMEATTAGDLNQPFLGGAIPAGPAYFTARHDLRLGWVIDGGAVHGIPAPAGAETTTLAIFSFDTPVDDLQSLVAAIGEASVTASFPGQSAVALTLRTGQPADPQTTYKAVVTGLPLPPMIVTLAGDEAGLALVRTALAQAGPDRTPSLLVREGDREAAALILRAEENSYRIRRKGDGYALLVETRAFTPASAQLVVHRLEHIARWRKIIDLANPASRLSEGDIGLEIELPDGQGGWQPAAGGAAVGLAYTFQDGQWQQPTFRVKLTNRSRRRLYCMAFDLTEVYGVASILPGVWLAPGAETWANAGEPVYAEVPDDLWQAGVVQINDTLLVVASTDEGDATQLEQEDLPVTVLQTRSAPKSVQHMSTLNRLLHRVQTRNFSTKPAGAEVFADWITTAVSFTTVRPLEAAKIAPGKPTVLGQGVTVLGHPALQAHARLTTLPDVSRDAGNLTLPAILRDHPECVEPFEFSSNRGGQPGLSVLELLNVQDSTVVTPEAPLVIQINAHLKESEVLLPLGYDGEFFLPLGRVARTAAGVQVELDRLPPPTGTRTLGGSIKILFQKLVGQPLGLAYDYPRLSVVTVDRSGHVAYDNDPAHVRRAVTQVHPGQRIVLYIHGIIGDTAGMACSARTEALALPTPVGGLADRYKLMLAFDYENLHTSIKDNALLLRHRLADAGLGTNHGRQLHIVAHSMGGLLSRWFIEREGGNQVVQHLVMLGTPNAGSPWSTVEDWATAALGIGLNALSAIAWPAPVLGLLVAALEKVDVSLDEMKPGSDFLKKLAASPDPGIPYTIIAGNTSIVPAALKPEPGKATSVFDRLWARVKPKQWLHTVTAPVFFGQPNDIAATVASIESVPAGRPAVAPPVEVACDHITYFSTVAGLEALGNALP